MELFGFSVTVAKCQKKKKTCFFNYFLFKNTLKYFFYFLKFIFDVVNSTHTKTH